MSKQNKDINKCKVYLEDTSKLKPYPRNIKSRSKSQIKVIANSIKTYGFDQPIVVDKDFFIVKGTGRYLASISLGLTKVPIIYRDDLTFEEANASRIADNKVAMSEWNSALKDEMVDLYRSFDVTPSQLGFTSTQAKKLFPFLDTIDSMKENEAGLNVVSQVEVPLVDEKDNSIKDDHTVTVDDNKAVKEEIIENTEVKQETKKSKTLKVSEQRDQEDASVPLTNTMMLPFEGEDLFLRKLSMLDYLNYHDEIVIGFSGGKDSLAALIYCLENCDKDRLKPYFSSIGWGVDWSYAYAVVAYIEKRYDIKVNVLGPADPAFPTKFNDLLLQYGYPNAATCWVRNFIKMYHPNAWFSEQEKFSESNKKIVQVLAVRWSEGANRQKLYADRGILINSKLHFASPIIQWTNADLVKYLHDKKVPLNPVYSYTHRMGCVCCPHTLKHEVISIRKLFPYLYKMLIEYHAIGAKAKGKCSIDKHHFFKLVSSIEDMPQGQHLVKFQSPFSSLALNSVEFEKELAKYIGERKYPFLPVKFDEKLHGDIVHNDLNTDLVFREVSNGDITCSSFG